MKIPLTALAISLATMASVQSASKPADISNIQPRRDINGQIIDAHDGCLELFDGTYYLYGTAYGATNGMGKTNHYVCYSSPDLVTWTPHGDILKDAPVRRSYRPYVKYNKQTGKYVLWYNADSDYGVATADHPTGPFTIQNPSVKLKYSKPAVGDLGFFVDDDGTGYVAYTADVSGEDKEKFRAGLQIKTDPIPHHRISVEKLTSDYLGSTMENSGFVAGNCEGPTLFKRQGTYYLLFDNTCCFGAHGSGARVYTATAPLGPYQYRGNINIAGGSALVDSPWTKPGTGRPNSTIPAQQTDVATLPADHGPVYLWMGDRWHSTPDKIKGHDFQFWTPLQFEKDGMIKPLEWRDSIGDRNFASANPQ